MSGVSRLVNSSLKRTGAALAFAARVGLAWGAGFGAAGLLRLGGGDRTPTMALTALFACAFGPWIASAARRDGLRRPLVATSFALVGLAPISTWFAWLATREAVVETHWRCGTGDFVFVVVPFLLAFVGMTAGLVALLLARPTRFVDRVIRGATWITFGASAALVLGAVVRWIHMPDVDTYVTSLPSITLSPDESPVGFRDGARPSPVYRVTCKALEARESCGLWVGDAAPAPSVRDLGRGAIVLRRDALHGITIVEQVGSGRSVLRDREGHATSDELAPAEPVYVNEVADGLAPPLGWIAGGVLGLVVAAFLRARRQKLDRERALYARGLAGVMGDNGWVSFDGGAAPVRAPEGTPLGEVTVIADTIGVAYRRGEASPEHRVLPGSPDALLQRARDALAENDAMALCALGLGAAPLVAAWLAHLV